MRDRNNAESGGLDGENSSGERSSSTASKTALEKEILDQERLEQALQESEERYRLLFDTMTEGFALHEIITDERGRPRDYRFLEVNPAFERLTGLKRPDLIGRSVQEVLPSIEPYWIETYGRVALTGEPAHVENFSAALGRWFEVLAYRPLPGQFAVVFSDITGRKRNEEDLRSSEVQFRGMFERHQAAMLLIEPKSGAIVDVNPSAARFYGYSREELRRMRITDINRLSPEEVAAERRRAATEERNYFIFPHQLADGRVRWVEVYASPFEMSPGPMLFSIIHDITDRRESEEVLQTSRLAALNLMDDAVEARRQVERVNVELLESRERFRALAEAIPAVTWTADEKGIVEWHSRKWYEFTGLPERSGDRGDRLQMTHPDDLLGMLKRWAEACSSGTIYENEQRFRRHDGEYRWFLVRAWPQRDGEGRVVRWFGTDTDINDLKQAEEHLKQAHDELEVRVQERTAALTVAVEALQLEISEREELEKTLRASEQQVRFFAAQCLTVQEQERKRIAGELHDSLASMLVAVKYRLEKAAEQMVPGIGPQGSLQDVLGMLGVLNKEVRRIMVDLRPAVLDDLGLLPALNWLCREFEKSYGHIRVEKQTELSETDLAEGLKTPIFRLTQEALNNIAKHSGAGLVHIQLGKTRNQIVLTIRDNGRGFDPDGVAKGLGLTTMKERTELSGGAYCLESVPGEGTTLYASWPIED